MTQWHPLFAQLLRPILENEFDIQTNVPVGDMPREADIVLVRRLSAGATKHTGLWRWLTRCVLAGERELWQPYGGTISWLHPELEKEIELMARTKTKGLQPSFGPLVRWMGKKEAARQLLEEVGAETVIEECVDALTPAQRADLLRRLQEPQSQAAKGKRRQ